VSRTKTATPPDAGERFLAGLAFLASTVLLIGVPFVWDSAALDMFRGPKSALALAAWATLAAIFLVANAGGAAWRDAWWLVWGGVAAGGAASAIASSQPARSLTALVPFVLAALGWGAVRQLSEGRRRALATLVVWAGVIEAVLVLVFLRASWQPQSFAMLSQGHGRYQWIGTFGNPADVAVFLLLPALLAAGRAVATHRHRAFNVAAALLMIGVILGTRTMTTFVALTVGAAAILLVKTRRRRRLGLVAVVLAVALAVLAVTPLGQRVRIAVRETRAGGLLWLGSARFAAYAAAASMIGARPLTGVGFGLYEANSFRFQTLDALAARGHILGLQTGFGEAHNDLLQYAAETGVLGLALAAAGVVLAVRRRRRGEGAVVHFLPLAAAALVLALTQFPLHLAGVAAQWTVLAALALPALPSPPPLQQWPARARILVAGLLIGAALVLAWRQYRATTYFGQAKLLSATLRAAPQPGKRGAQIARVALANLVPEQRWLPYSWQASLVLGNIAIDAGETGQALAAFERALALAERPEVEFDVGIALRMAGDREAAMAHLVRAVQLNPAIFREVRDPDLSRALRRRLDDSGYGARHTWMYTGTPAANP
jgi:tetratricopeptide (TPR) repeat protein